MPDVPTRQEREEGREGSKTKVGTAKVSQATVNRVKALGQAAAVRQAMRSKDPEFKEAVRRIYPGAFKKASTANKVSGAKSKLSQSNLQRAAARKVAPSSTTKPRESSPPKSKGGGGISGGLRALAGGALTAAGAVGGGLLGGPPGAVAGGALGASVAGGAETARRAKQESDKRKTPSPPKPTSSKKKPQDRSLAERRGMTRDSKEARKAAALRRLRQDNRL